MDQNRISEICELNFESKIFTFAIIDSMDMICVEYLQGIFDADDIDLDDQEYCKLASTLLANIHFFICLSPASYTNLDRKYVDRLGYIYNNLLKGYQYLIEQHGKTSKLPLEIPVDDIESIREIIIQYRDNYLEVMREAEGKLCTISIRDIQTMQHCFNFAQYVMIGAIGLERTNEVLHFINRDVLDIIRAFKEHYSKSGSNIKLH